MALLELILAPFGDRPVILLGVVAFVLYFVAAIAASVSKQNKIPAQQLPWVGKTSGSILAGIQASFKSINSVRDWLDEGYNKYSKLNKTYLLPDFSGHPQIVVPNSDLHWLVDKPDNEVSTSAAHYELLAGKYAFTDSNLLKVLFHEHVIHRTLARKLQDLIPGTWEEIADFFDETWGTKPTSEWRTIGVHANMTQMIARVSNRMFVGTPLCRDEAFLNTNAAFATDVITCFALLGLVPDFLKPIVGPILSIPNHYHYWLTRKWTLPIINQRLADMETLARDPSTKIDIPEDYFTWHIRLARAEGRPKELDPVYISRCLLAIEFAAIHTTTFSITTILFDLVSSDPSEGFLEGLREEAERVYHEENGQWTKRALNRLVRTDSAIRESMRLSEMMASGMQRKVLAPHGVRNEREGWTAPYGAYISIPVSSRHRDPSIYPEPDKYDAFRFSRPREQYEASDPDFKNSREWLQLQNTTIVSTSENFLAFGHGRHACPGRFFVQQELKMLLAYMVMHYDVQPLKEKPAGSKMGGSVLPPMKATIQIRRRQ